MTDQRKINRPAPKRDTRRAELAMLHALFLDKSTAPAQFEAAAAKLERANRLPAIVALLRLEADRRS